MLGSLFGSVLLASVSFQPGFALPTIGVKGAKFFADGHQFFLKGLAYQGTPDDPLYNTNQCELDAKLMQEIGTNSIRVYHVDPYVNHDGCMKAFADAGIYVWLDLDTFNTTIVQTAPIWTEEQFLAFAKVLDVFQAYDNLAGFWIGNEVINTATGSLSAPYIKAAVADMKSYMAAKSYRTIPIGYSAADIAELRPMLQNYLACGSQVSQAIDFFGLNSYEWCGDSSYSTSGYSNLQQLSETYSIPIFFSETGCNVPEPRTFSDQGAIFGPKMIGTWSGSIIYEWVEETNHYGLVTYPSGQIYNGAPIPLVPDYQNLANVWKSITPTGISESEYTPSYSAPACPLATGGWVVNGDVPLPTLGPKVVQAAAAGKVVLPSSSSLSSSTQQAITTPLSTSDMPPPSASSIDSPLSTFSFTSSSSIFVQSLLKPGTTSSSLSASITSTQSLSALIASVTTNSAASAATSHSSAPSYLHFGLRVRGDNDFWSLPNLFKTSGWFVTIILPIVGVIGIVSFL